MKRKLIHSFVSFVFCSVRTNYFYFLFANQNWNGLG
jgi:hypothetical protein